MELEKYKCLVPRNWTNNVCINGIICAKPVIESFTGKNGQQVEKATFSIHQFTYSEHCYKPQNKHIQLETYSKKVIDTLKGITKQSIINCLGMITRRTNKNNKDIHYVSIGCNITEIEITETFVYDILEKE